MLEKDSEELDARLGDIFQTGNGTGLVLFNVSDHKCIVLLHFFLFINAFSACFLFLLLSTLLSIYFYANLSLPVLGFLSFHF